MSRNPTEEQRQAARDRANAYRTKNREMVLAKKRAHYASNRVEILDKMKAHYYASGRAKFIENYYLNRETILLEQKQKRANDGEKVRERERKWYANNRERELAKAKQDRINNPSKYRILDKELYARNKSKILARQKAFNATPAGKLATLLRNTARRIAKLGNVTNQLKKDLLGAPIEFVRLHIESQFLPGMSWKNHGKHGWHIDHIKPISSFDLTDPEQVKKAGHYTNLAPLWAYDNWSKGAKTS
jgi:hypothetical protein